MAQERWAASAPAKVILFGEHAVNRAQPALVTAVDLRTTCTATRRSDTSFLLEGDGRRRLLTPDDLRRLLAEVGALRADGNTQAIRRLAGEDFFAPTAYVLATFQASHSLPGMDIAWQSAIPIGSGLGSGAAASAAMVLALCGAARIALSPYERAGLAWQGDIIAHGGIASGLDSSGATFGGIVCYTLADGPRPVSADLSLPIVIGHTGIRASTAEVNGRVRAWLEANPEGGSVFPSIGALVERALPAIALHDLRTLGGLIDQNQALLSRIGVSCPEIDRLTAAARGAGALGAKLSGSGGGGIILALAEAEQLPRVAAAIEAAGGQAIVTRAGIEGARIERHPL